MAREPVSVTYANPSRAPKPAPRPIDPVKPRYVYDPSIGLSLAGRDIIEKDGERIVMMSDAEAQFYIDQGTLGNKPMEKRRATAQVVGEQLVGTAEPEKAKPKK